MPLRAHSAIPAPLQGRKRAYEPPDSRWLDLCGSDCHGTTHRTGRVEQGTEQVLSPLRGRRASSSYAALFSWFRHVLPGKVQRLPFYRPSHRVVETACAHAFVRAFVLSQKLADLGAGCQGSSCVRSAVPRRSLTSQSSPVPLV